MLVGALGVPGRAHPKRVCHAPGGVQAAALHGGSFTAVGLAARRDCGLIRLPELREVQSSKRYLDRALLSRLQVPSRAAIFDCLVPLSNDHNGLV